MRPNSPTPAFRAAFAAGAAWAQATTSRPDVETAVQQAWEARGITPGDDRGQTSYPARAVRAVAIELDRTGHGGNPPELLDLYALLVLTRGVDCALADVHDAWAMWRLRTRPDHLDLVPFDQLTDEVKAYDGPYRDAIVAAARALTSGETS